MKPGGGPPAGINSAMLESMNKSDAGHADGGAGIPDQSQSRPATGVEGETPVSPFFEAGGNGLGSSLVGAKAGLFALVEGGQDMLAHLASTSLNSFSSFFGNALGSNITDAFEGNSSPFSLSNAAVLEDANLLGDMRAEGIGPVEGLNMKAPTLFGSQGGGGQSMG